MKSITSIFLIGLLSACGEMSPYQGSGSLYIFKHGISKCVNVRSVCFISSRTTQYTDREGRDFSISEPVAYYSGESCK